MHAPLARARAHTHRGDRDIYWDREKQTDRDASAHALTKAPPKRDQLSLSLSHTHTQTHKHLQHYSRRWWPQRRLEDQWRRRNRSSYPPELPVEKKKQKTKTAHIKHNKKQCWLRSFRQEIQAGKCSKLSLNQGSLSNLHLGLSWLWQLNAGVGFPAGLLDLHQLLPFTFVDSFVCFFYLSVSVLSSDCTSARILDSYENSECKNQDNWHVLGTGENVRVGVLHGIVEENVFEVVHFSVLVSVTMP